MEIKEVKLSVELVNAILQYLGDKPFKESSGYINAIHQQVQPQLQPRSEEVLEVVEE